MRSNFSSSQRWVLAILAWVITASAFGQSFQQATAVPPPNVDLSNVKIIQRIGNQLPMDVPFTDQDGKSVTLGSFKSGRPVLMLAIFYLCTGVCSLEMESLATTLGKMTDLKVGKDFDVVIVGINPKETPDLAKAKLAETLATSPNFQGTKAGWHFLTGTLPNIRSVTNKLGFFYTYDPETETINHAAGIMFVTPTGVVSSYILGAQFDSDEIRRNIATAKKSQLGIKSPDIFFGCIHIDPLTGKRSIVVENVLKVAGAITVLGILLTILTLSGKTRLARKRAEKKDPDGWY